jgi:cytochrome c-type biogenesis protein CcmE
MTRKQRRLVLTGSGLAVLAVAIGLILNALSDSIVFFNSPSDVTGRHVRPGTRIRLGGLVKERRVVRDNNLSVRFEVTDGKSQIPVEYRGVLPDLLYCVAQDEVVAFNFTSVSRNRSAISSAVGSSYSIFPIANPNSSAIKRLG